MVTKTFTAGQDFTVPDGVFSLEVELEGEAGQDGNASGGDGGRVVGEVSTTPGEVFRIRSTSGGDAQGPDGGVGGGAVDIRQNGTTLTDRIAVAAGGGGGGNDLSTGLGGDGGANTGETGGDGENTTGGGGGTQTAGGAGGSGSGVADSDPGEFGTGGDATFATTDGGGGGAGWYGGGGGGSGDSAFTSAGSGGGGGSNYDDGLDSVTANERGTSTRTHGEGGLVTITYEQTPGAENLAITDTTTTSNTLDWDAPTLPPEVDSVDQYRIYRATDPGTTRADYTEVGTTPTPGFEDTGLDNGTGYHYRVGADLVVN